jgi:hypothetical protein
MTTVDLRASLSMILAQLFSLSLVFSLKILLQQDFSTGSV